MCTGPIMGGVTRIEQTGVILKAMVEPEAMKSQFKPELVDINALIFDLTRLTDQALLTHQVRLRTDRSSQRDTESHGRTGSDEVPV